MLSKASVRPSFMLPHKRSNTCSPRSVHEKEKLSNHENEELSYHEKEIFLNNQEDHPSVQFLCNPIFHTGRDTTGTDSSLSSPFLNLPLDCQVSKHSQHLCICYRRHTEKERACTSFRIMIHV